MARLTLFLATVALFACEPTSPSDAPDVGSDLAEARLPPDAAPSCAGDACCLPACAPGLCGGDDGCGGTCGPCADGAVCQRGFCCAPLCLDRECGTDGCGGVCGACRGTLVCAKGHCIDDVVPHPGPCAMDWDGDGDGVFERAQTYRYEDDLLVESDADGGGAYGMRDGQRDELATYENDAAGRLASMRIDRGLDGTTDFTSDYEYDAQGRLATRLVDENGDRLVDAVWVYYYDATDVAGAAGCLIENDRNGGLDMRISYTYDEDGDRTTTVWERMDEGVWKPYTEYRSVWDGHHNLLTRYIFRAGHTTVDGEQRFTYDCWER